MPVVSLHRLIGRVISYGSLTVITPGGVSHSFGTGEEPRVAIRIHDSRVERRLLFRPGLAVGEAYTDGSLMIEEGTLRDLLDILLKSREKAIPTGAWGALLRAFKAVRFYPEIINGINRSRRNVQHHYDLGNELYRLFLDRDMQYSCAYFRQPGLSLDEAQFEKKEHLARKLMLQPGMHVLDIGSGWGGLALHLARHYGVRVTGITLSREQLEVSVRRAAEMDLSDRLTFQLRDYRETGGQYDRIVSVGMFEHIGQPYFREFFQHVFGLLAEDGIAVLHTIGRMNPPEPIGIWIRRQIFPGAYLPALSELAPILEKLGFLLTDLENWRLHYAETLRRWDERFQQNRREIAALYDEKFCRMWEFYLQSCERAFQHQRLCVFQLQLAKSIGAVPLTRDYMYPSAGAAAVSAGSAPSQAHSSPQAPRRAAESLPLASDPIRLQSTGNFGRR
jgi:cyclopropane-fatty-acyl-phospholipid synthase